LLRLEFLLSPELFIIGGGVSKEQDKFLPYVHTRTRTVAAQFLNHAGIIGAALAARDAAGSRVLGRAGDQGRSLNRSQDAPVIPASARRAASHNHIGA
jgi:hypothetical protein